MCASHIVPDNRSGDKTPQETIEDLREFAARYDMRAFSQVWPWGGHTVWGLTGRGPTAGWWSSEYDALAEFAAAQRRDGDGA